MNAQALTLHRDELAGILERLALAEIELEKARSYAAKLDRKPLYGMIDKALRSVRGVKDVLSLPEYEIDLILVKEVQ